MIWYLLYPFRGTTEPPKLEAKHPLRRAFTRYGNQAARHPVITLLISVAVATILIYPFPFLYTTDFIKSAGNLPHHVWTSAQPYEGSRDIQPDVVMRSIWVHGDYMKALDPKVLLGALEIQNTLLGSTTDFNPKRAHNELLTDNIAEWTTDVRDSFHAINGLTNSSWFFHSPLQYWDCSGERIAQDNDIITTVNEASHQSTSVNVTLRHSIVFSGKRFEDRRLVAADALVITLLHKLDSPVGTQWQKNAAALADKNSAQWQIFPSGGRSLTSTLYEFRFQPLSSIENLWLMIIYAVTITTFFRKVSNIRALKSRLGLIAAVLTQIIVSVAASFTICAVLKIDLSKLPWQVYPLAPFIIGSQNVLVLITSVITTPSDRSTPYRMGEALGNAGYIALGSFIEKIILVWVMSKTVFLPVEAFCTFCQIANVLDFFFLMTFFTAVLSIDVRRTELSDTLSRVITRSGSNTPDLEPRKTWTDSILRGEAPVSTRIAGTIVMIGFVLIAQWHFTDSENFFSTASRLIRILRSRPDAPLANSSSILSIDIHQARTPTAWLRMQDHETAQEVINIIKPHAPAYIARVYEPLIFVLDGANRTKDSSGVRPFLPAAYDFVHHQLKSFIAVVLFLVAAVCLLMNYLLWNELSESDPEERPDDEPLLSVKTLSQGHFLDIVLLEASNNGVIATVGLDRFIRIWDVQKRVYGYIVGDQYSGINNPFPVLAMAIDSDSNWLALLSASDELMLWNIPERRWGPIMQVDIKGRAPAGFFFGSDETEFIDPVTIVRHNGIMTEIHPEANETREMRICKSPLVCVRPHFEKRPNIETPPRIITSSRRGCIHVASQLAEGWVSEGLEIPEPDDDREVKSILPLPALSSFLAVRDHTVDLIDIFTHKVTHSFSTSPMKVDSLRCFHSTRRRPQCGSVGLASLAIAYTCAETGSCILQSYLPQREGDTICFRDPYTPGSKTCCLWRETVEHRYVVENPGKWEVLQVGYVAGVRKREQPKPTGGTVTAPAAQNIRRRGLVSKPDHGKKDRHDDIWEAWSISARGDRSSTPLFSDAEKEDCLLVSGLGPMTRFGKRNVAVALGNVVKVVTVGNDRLDDTASDDDAAFVGMAPSRKKKTNVSHRKKAV
ncbi:sterol-sensing domain of SREBP cleavage-activation-domain-containing protein [Tricladium varicosporioides]|nr:sterol-sensing domain of SREBP cleavage-activation-domain-containing protein [Hymenoscyphus varicosporioides]